MGFFSGNMQMQLFQIFVRAIVLVTAMPIHEFAHGYAADKLGDSTARIHGRLNLNPLTHLDPIGTILLLFTGFGWAKPIPINPRYFSRKVSMRGGVAITALAGPASNVIMAFVLMILANIAQVFAFATGIGTMGYMGTIVAILSMMAQVNVSLAVFNLLPLPPLDGYNIAQYFLPNRLLYKIEANQRTISLVLLALLLFTPIVSFPLQFFGNLIMNGLEFLSSFVFVIGNLFI